MRGGTGASAVPVAGGAGSCCKGSGTATGAAALTGEAACSDAEGMVSSLGASRCVSARTAIPALMITIAVIAAANIACIGFVALGTVVSPIANDFSVVGPSLGEATHAGDWNMVESLDSHFNLPRVSALFHDLNPGVSGTVSWRQFTDRAAVTFQGESRYPFARKPSAKGQITTGIGMEGCM